MPRGDKSKYTDKQERKADHIAEGYEKRGVSEKEAERRAWATVNTDDGGGKNPGVLDEANILVTLPHTKAEKRVARPPLPGQPPRDRHQQKRRPRPASETRVKRMNFRLLSDDDGVRVYVLVLDDGEEAFQSISDFAASQKLSAASISAIGALRRATVGWFDFQTKKYREIPVDQQCEVLSAIGDIAVGDDGKPSLHLHAVLGLSDGTTRGGHFLRGDVHPTVEAVITETPAYLRRRKRPELGVALIDL